MRICKKCLLPETYDTIKIAQDGLSCNLCESDQAKITNINWENKKQQLDKLIEKYRDKYEYDCIIPFSGGKDSTYALYYLKKQYNIKPLVVRFDSGFMRPKHAQNIQKTIKKLGVDYISFTPNWNTIRLLMKAAFLLRTDFCWHCHTGIYSYPLRLAVKYNTPLVFWGESLSEMLGTYVLQNDTVEFEDATRFNDLRTLGINADEMYLHLQSKGITIDKRDLTPYTYPTAEELKKLGYYSVCLGSFIPWDYRANTDLIQRELGWEIDTVEGVPFEVNKEGAKTECWLQASRDYIKYMKRGYGRVTQCVNFEIRKGRLTTEQGKNIIARYEGRKPQSLDIFLKYIGMSEHEFNNIIEHAAIPPFKPDFSLKKSEIPPDFASYYKED